MLTILLSRKLIKCCTKRLGSSKNKSSARSHLKKIPDHRGHSIKINKQVKLNETSIMHDLSLPGLKTLENVRMRNAKSTLSRNLGIERRAYENYNYSMMVPDSSGQNLSLKQSSLSHINLPYVTFESEQQSHITRILLKSKEGPRYVYVNEKYEEVDVPEDQDNSSNSPARSKSPKKGVTKIFLKHAQMFREK